MQKAKKKKKKNKQKKNMQTSLLDMWVHTCSQLHTSEQPFSQNDSYTSSVCVNTCDKELAILTIDYT